MTTSNYECRVFVIGDYQVGKNSIVKRFKKLNNNDKFSKWNKWTI